jgi:GMP synthase PP-ATPase subunit
MGDSRTFEYTCLLRAVISEDGKKKIGHAKTGPEL